MQEQAACEPINLHWEFGPHGDGTQGFSTSLSNWIASKQKKIFKLTCKEERTKLNHAYVQVSCIEQMDLQ